MTWPSASRSAIRLTDAQRIDWLRLSRTEGVGPLTFKGLVNRFGGAAAALDALPALLKARGKSPAAIPGEDDALRELEAAHRAGARIVALGEAEYPALLRRIDAAPPLLAIKGRAEVFRHPFVAIVGSRNASGAGRAFADRLAAGLTREGFGVVSGLARGIDTRAHESSLAFGTVAVLAGGIDRPYPPENANLLERILENGAVVSEMPFGWAPRGRDFPRRNRIISGVAYGTVVVEAARKSGSLITARFANEQGREVFAVPGSPLDPRAEGTNDLIREGAGLCASVEDITRVLAPMIAAPDLFELPPGAEEPEGTAYRAEPFWDELLGEADGNDPAAGDAAWLAAQYRSDDEDAAGASSSGATPGGKTPGDLRAAVLAALGPSPLEVDEVIRLSGGGAAKVRAVLLDLDLAGRLERHGGNRISLIVS